ncbi:MAG: P-loop NTPase [Candidatus Aenigmarchaeota archaeon]|nr:P-loop NTPase [Candidatus Aenigmarchaeota archaeon]
MRKIAIVSGKGGIGKTTLAINLGYLLHKKFDFDTTVVDCNLTTPHLSVNLGLYNANRTLNDVLRGKARLEEAIIEHPTGIKILPASIELKDLENIEIGNLSGILQGSNSNLILDSAPGLGREGIAAISAADEILFVTQPYTTAVVDIYRCGKIAEKLDKKILGVVVNYRKGFKHELNDNEIEQLTEVPIIGTIPYDMEIEKSLAAKLPLHVYNQKAPSNVNFHSLASHITGNKIKKESFFNRLKNIFKKEGRLLWGY